MGRYFVVFTLAFSSVLAIAEHDGAAREQAPAPRAVAPRDDASLEARFAKVCPGPGKHSIPELTKELALIQWSWKVLGESPNDDFLSRSAIAELQSHAQGPCRPVVWRVVKERVLGDTKRLPARIGLIGSFLPQAEAAQALSAMVENADLQSFTRAYALDTLAAHPEYRSKIEAWSKSKDPGLADYATTVLNRLPPLK